MTINQLLKKTKKVTKRGCAWCRHLIKGKESCRCALLLHTDRWNLKAMKKRRYSSRFENYYYIGSECKSFDSKPYKELVVFS